MGIRGSGTSILRSICILQYFSVECSCGIEPLPFFHFPEEGARFRKSTNADPYGERKGGREGG